MSLLIQVWFCLFCWISSVFHTRLCPICQIMLFPKSHYLCLCGKSNSTAFSNSWPPVPYIINRGLVYCIYVTHSCSDCLPHTSMETLKKEGFLFFFFPPPETLLRNYTAKAPLCSKGMGFRFLGFWWKEKKNPSFILSEKQSVSLCQRLFT